MVVNLSKSQGAKTVDLGGLNHDGTPQIPLTLISSTRFTSTREAVAVARPAFIEVLIRPSRRLPAAATSV